MHRELRGAEEAGDHVTCTLRVPLRGRVKSQTEEIRAAAAPAPPVDQSEALP